MNRAEFYARRQQDIEQSALGHRMWLARATWWQCVIYVLTGYKS